MTYKSIPYQSLNDSEKQAFIDFLKDARTETTQPAHENMWDDDWSNKNNTLPYILEYTDRFSNNGIYQVLFDGNKVVASSGAYVSAFCDELAIVGVRTWIRKEYRNLSLAREYLLPIEKAWAIENKLKAIAVSFNDYNKNIATLWKRMRLGENRTPRQSYHMFYNGINEITFPVNIQYTKQWVMYEKLDKSFDYDWSKIKWQD